MLSVCVHGSQLCWPKAQVYETVSSHSDLQMLHSHNIALCQWEYIDLDCLLYVTISILLYPLIMDSLQWFIYFRSFPIPAQMDKFLTFRTDLADFLHIVLGAIVDGMRDSALADSLVLAGRCRAEHGHVLHRLAQLSGGNAHATCRKLINSYDFMKKKTYDLWWILLQRLLTWIQVHLVVQGGTELNRAVAEGTQEFPFHRHFLLQVNVISIIYCPSQ